MSYSKYQGFTQMFIIHNCAYWVYLNCLDDNTRIYNIRRERE